MGLAQFLMAMGGWFLLMVFGGAVLLPPIGLLLEDNLEDAFELARCRPLRGRVRR